MENNYCCIFENLTEKSILMFIVGSMFLLFASISFKNRGINSNCIQYFILGILLFIPGSYHTVIIARIIRGDRGYTYDLISYLDEN